MTEYCSRVNQGFPNSFFKSPPLESLKRKSPHKTFFFAFHMQLENVIATNFDIAPPLGNLGLN